MKEAMKLVRQDIHAVFKEQRALTLNRLSEAIFETEECN